MSTSLQRTAVLVTDLARPRASLGIVAAVALVGELIAMVVAYGATTLTPGRLDDVVITLAVVAAASAAIGQVSRSGHVREPGHRWLLSGWVVIAALAATGVRDLPLALTSNPAGSAGIDRALLLVVAWNLALALAVLGADLWPEARRLPSWIMGAIGVAGLVGGAMVPTGGLIGPTGPTLGYVLAIAVVAGISLVAIVLWLMRWRVRGGWSLTWSGTGLLLSTTALLLQLVAEFGNERIWVAATGMILSSMIVPGLGAAAAGTALAGAHTLARRQLREEFEGSSEDDEDLADLPILESLAVRLAPVVNLESGEPVGSLAHAVLPGLSVDWWRSQAATMGLGTRLETALAARALMVVATESDPSRWVVVPVDADAVGQSMLSSLPAEATGSLVVIVKGRPEEQVKALPRLAERGVTTGVMVTGMDARTVEAIDRADPALLVVDNRLVGGIARDGARRAAVTAVVTWATGRSRGVMAVEVDDGADLAVLRELGVRYAAGAATTRQAVASGSVPDAGVLDLIEAAGLREPRGSDQT